MLRRGMVSEFAEEGGVVGTGKFDSDILDVLRRGGIDGRNLVFELAVQFWFVSDVAVQTACAKVPPSPLGPLWARGRR